MNKQTPLIRPTKKAPQVQEETTKQVFEQSFYAGPIPHPEMLKQFNEVDVTFAERLFKMAEKQNEEQIAIKKRISISNALFPILGQVFTFLLGLSGIVAGFILAIKGFSPAAITAILSGSTPVLVSALKNIFKK